MIQTLPFVEPRFLAVVETQAEEEVQPQAALTELWY